MAKGGSKRGVMVRGALVRRTREALGMTQEDLAKNSDRVRGTVGKAESGGPLDKPTVQALARALDLPYVAVARPDPARRAAAIAALGLSPEPPAPPFVGREVELRRLVRLLCGGPRRRVWLLGMPGVGKSALARAAALDPEVARSHPDGVIWVDAGALEPARLAPLQMDIATTLECGEAIAGLFNQRSERFGAAFRHGVSGCEALLVLDDLPSLVLLEQLVGPEAELSVLVTSTQRDVCAALGDDGLELPLLPREAATALLAHYLGEERLRAQPEGLEELMSAVGRVPGSLHIAGSLLRREAFTPLSDYAGRVRRNAQELSDRRGARFPALARQWNQVASLESVRRQVSDEAWACLARLGLFGHHRFSCRWAAGLCGAEPTEVARWLAELSNVCLLRPGEARGAGRTPRWFVLEEPVRSYARWRAAEEGTAPRGSLAAGALAEAEVLARTTPARRLARFSRLRSLWGKVLGELAAAVAARCAGPLPEMARRAREQAPEEAPRFGEEAAVLNRLVALLGDVLTQCYQHEAPTWLLAAFVSAGEPLERAALALVIGRQQYPDFAAAQRWFAWAGQVFEEAGDLTRAAEALTESGKMLHGTRRYTAGLVPLERAAALSRRAGDPPHLLAVRGNNLAIAHLILREGFPAQWRRAAEALDEALERLQGEDDEGVCGDVQRVVALNRVTCQLLAGESAPEREEAEQRFFARLPEGSLFASYPRLTAHWLARTAHPPSAAAADSTASPPHRDDVGEKSGLGLPGDGAQPRDGVMAWARELWSRALTAEHSRVDRYLRHLSCVTANLQMLTEERQRARAGVIAGGIPGTVGIIDAAYDFPWLAQSVGSMGLVYLIEPFEQLFADPELLRRLLQVAEYGYGRDHLATQNVAALCRRATEEQEAAAEGQR